MKKFQSQDLPLGLTMLALFISSASNKIEEWTSIPSKIVLYVGAVISIIPLYIWISGWLKHRKNK
jgi:tellurite resistance protein TehA-like permease